MEKSILKQKCYAFLVHLLLSVFIALMSLMLVYKVWYKNSLDVATGVTQLFLLMVTIDLIIGPLLTFVVYKKPKKTLKFDLLVIIFLQLAALIYGLYSVYNGKPAWLAYNVDRFEVIRENEIDKRKIAIAESIYQKTPFFGAKYVNATLSEQEKEKNIELSNEILFDEVQYGISPAQRPELYKPIETAYATIIKRAASLVELNSFNSPEEVKSILKRYPEADSFVPLKANAVDMTVLINKKQGGKVVAIVDLRPWQF